ncbi:MAG: dTDP-4-dehydrorhamnose reductase [Lachnospiraceae bacterium]
MRNEVIWIVGGKGRIGKALCNRLETLKYKTLETDVDVDVTDMDMVMNFININRPNVVINCTGLTDPTECEQNRVKAYQVNALGARNLAVASRKVNAKLIQMSTDDVFAGNERIALNEFHIPTPLTVYGKSKLAGEQFVKELNPKHLIIRSSWVYSPEGNDFISKVIEAGRNHTPLSVVADQFSTPTNVSLLAEMIEQLLDANEYGIYHASCRGVCSRIEFAQHIFNVMGFDTSIIQPIFYQGDDNTLLRPRYTVLENLMLEMTELFEMPDWKDELTLFLNKYYK